METNSLALKLAAASAKSKLVITAAYKFVAMAVMLTNCNLFVQQVHLPLDHPIVQTNVILSRCSVAPPRLMDFTGSLVTEKYFFGFGHGHLANFWQWQFHAESLQGKIRAKQEEWSKMPSQISTNDVYSLALNWLNNLGVDVTTLEQKYPCKIMQRFFYKSPNGSLAPLDKSKVPLPIFEISWGSIPLRGHPQYSFPAATMTIFGPTKELIEYHLMDDSLMLRPKLEIKNYEGLLTITNEAFYKFDEMQRSNLIKQFTLQ
jgi:hypothetical protein